MALKGSATIELTNADGSKEIIKHDNMITNAVSDLLKSHRGEMAPIMKITSNGESYAQALFGGILLFDETLNNDPDDYFLPSLKVTGYASQNAYSGTDISRGSYNASESGLQEDGKSYKFVWDFSTAQANGTIKSLGLCPNITGKIGATSTRDSASEITYSLRSAGAPFNSTNYMFTSDAELDGYIAQNLYIVAIVDDIAYAISYDNVGFRGGSVSSDKSIANNGGKLCLFRFKLGANDISLNNVVGMATFLGRADVQMPTEFTSTFPARPQYSRLVGCTFDYASKKIYVFPDYMGSDVAVSGTIKYCDIDLSNNYAVTVHTFTNNTAGTIKCDQGNAYPSYNFFVLNSDYIINTSVKDGKNYLYITKTSDNTQVKEAKNSDGTPYVISSSTTYSNIAPLFCNGKIVIINNISNNGSTFYGTDSYIAVDLTTGEVKALNIAKQTMVKISNYTCYTTVDVGSKVFSVAVQGYLLYGQAVNPFVLTTKNNLSSPVTKTASQTMKITYTLTESEGT